jgi:hypothetical protein
MHDPDPELAELTGREALAFLRGGTRLKEVRLLDQRADDKALSSIPQALPNELVGAGALSLGDDPGLDRAPAGREAA